MSRMGTLIAPANPMIVSTNASIILSPPCCKHSVLTAGKIGPLGVHRADTLFMKSADRAHTIERGVVILLHTSRAFHLLDRTGLLIIPWLCAKKLLNSKIKGRALFRRGQV
jgi:hypothetical protein